MILAGNFEFTRSLVFSLRVDPCLGKKRREREEDIWTGGKERWGKRKLSLN